MDEGQDVDIKVEVAREPEMDKCDWRMDVYG